MTTLLTKIAPSVRHRAVALLAGILVLGSVAFVQAAGGKPDFSLSTAPTTQTVNKGQAATVAYRVSITRINGFTGNVALSYTGLPAGATATWPNGQSTVTLGPAETATTLTVRTAASTPAGTAPLRIAGAMVPGGSSHTSDASLVVQAPVQPTITLAATPAQQTVFQGSGATYAVSVTRGGGFTGSVSLNASGLPKGVTATFSPGTLAGTASSSTLQLATNPSTATGTYSVNIGASSSAGSPSMPVSLVVQAPSPTSGLRLSGNLAGDLIVGGPAQPVDLAIANGMANGLYVSGITATVTGTSVSACGTDNFAVTQMPSTYQLFVPGRSTRTLSQLGSAYRPTVRLVNLPRAQNACLGATINLRYTASGAVR